ncbi:KOW motif-containing protein [Chloroflexota bacterium]
MRKKDKVRVKSGDNAGREGVIADRFSGDFLNNRSNEVVLKGHWIVELEDDIRILEPEGNLEVIE